MFVLREHNFKSKHERATQTYKVQESFLERVTRFSAGNNHHFFGVFDDLGLSILFLCLDHFSRFLDKGGGVKYRMGCACGLGFFRSMGQKFTQPFSHNFWLNVHHLVEGVAEIQRKFMDIGEKLIK